MNRKLGLSLAVLTLASLTLVGCFQIHKFFSISMGTLSAQNGATSAGYYVDLEAESSVYRDNKDKFDDIADCAILGQFANNGASAVSADLWIVPTDTAPVTRDLAGVQAAGGVKMWSFALSAGETKSIDWNQSAGLFTASGKSALKAEIEGDGQFSVYIFGNTGTYDITATNASFVVIMAVSGFGGG